MDRSSAFENYPRSQPREGETGPLFSRGESNFTLYKNILYSGHSQSLINTVLLCLSHDRYHVARIGFSRRLPDHLNEEPEHPVDHLDKGDDGDPGEQSQGAANGGYLVKDVHPAMARDKACA